MYSFEKLNSVIAISPIGNHLFKTGFHFDMDSKDNENYSLFLIIIQKLAVISHKILIITSNIAANKCSMQNYH
jgi:Na+/H+ antiporter NhaB